jgi:lysozyme
MTPRNQRIAAGGLAGGSAATVLIIALSGPVIQGWEGRKTASYLDVAKVATICDGHTGPEVKLGQFKTNAQCDAIFDKDQRAVLGRIASCTRGEAPARVWAAMTVFSFNVGSGAYCAKFAPLIDQGQYQAACARLSLYNKAHINGQLVVVHGLDNRRAAERRLCESGLT